MVFWNDVAFVPLDTGLAENQIFGREAAIAPLDQFVLDLLTFLQGFLAGALDGGDVDEDVLAAIRRRDETITLSGVEPLHDSASHSALNASYRSKRRMPQPDDDTRKKTLSPNFAAAYRKSRVWPPVFRCCLQGISVDYDGAEPNFKHGRIA